MKFIPLVDPITNLIQAIYNNFSIDFPLYKPKSSQNYFGPCLLDKEKSYLIYITESDLKEYNSFVNMKKNTINKILNIININSFEIIQTSSKLDAIENDINQKLNDYKEKSIENIELEKLVKELNDLESNLEKSIKDLKSKEKNSIFEACNEAFQIKDMQKYKYTVMKKTIEDYLIYIKRAYEKNLINFKDCINKTRRASKELFSIIYAIEKRNNMDN